MCNVCKRSYGLEALSFFFKLATLVKEVSLIKIVAAKDARLATWSSHQSHRRGHSTHYNKYTLFTPFPIFVKCVRYGMRVKCVTSLKLATMVKFADFVACVMLVAAGVV